MMKKVWMAMAAAAAMTVFISAGAMAEENRRIEANGIAFEIPAELKDLVTVETEGLGDGVLVNVYETASVEAAKALGEEIEGAGWLFGISRVSEERVKKLRCGGMDGMEVFAEGDDFFLIYDHPTDVRFVREQYENIEEDQEQWTKLNEWAFENVREEILANDPGLEPEIFTNTTLDMFLAQAAYEPGTNFDIKSLEYGELDPMAFGEEDFIEELADNFVYEDVYDMEAPDGEYIVLNFEDEGVRFDFFLAEEGQNMIREVRKIGDEEMDCLYMANLKESDDFSRTTTGIMKAWCEAIVNGDD